MNCPWCGANEADDAGHWCGGRERFFDGVERSFVSPDLGDDPDGDLDEIEGIAAARAAGHGYQRRS